MGPGRLRALTAGRMLAGAAAALAFACATPPKPTANARRIAANPPAIVTGLVRGLDGRPVPGIGVRGIPRSAEVPWAPASSTACDGTFRLAVAAPADYGFLLVWRGESVVTSDPRDPALVTIPLAPGQQKSGVELTFLADDWSRITGQAVTAETPSCPPAPAPRP